MTEPNPFAVNKREVRVGVQLSTGKHLTGVVHCSERSDTHHGRERVKDVLNGNNAMLPVWSADDEGCVLVNKAFIVQVELIEPDLADPRDEDLTQHRHVELQMLSGDKLQGSILVSTPPERARTLDFLNRGERFFYLETAEGSRVIGLAHVVLVSDRAV